MQLTDYIVSGITLGHNRGLEELFGTNKEFPKKSIIIADDLRHEFRNGCGKDRLFLLKKSMLPINHSTEKKNIFIAS